MKSLKKPVKEQDTLNTIIEFLKVRNIPWIHVRNTGSIFGKNGNIRFVRNKFGQKGAPDIVACYRGKPLAIEVKSPIGRVRPEQKEWLSHWDESGGRSCIARSLDDVIRFLNVV